MTTDRVTAIYDAIDAFQRTHRLPGLQHAQIRGLLAEHLARALPAAVPVPPPADQTALRDRIADALATADGWQWAPGYDKTQSLAFQDYLRYTDAVLAVLPEQTDRAAETPAAECSAQNRNYESGPRLCIRAAQHHGDHINERGFHWSDTVAVYPVSDGTFRRGTDVRALLRRVAAEEQPAETEAHPPEHTWAAELHDPLADEWVPGTRYTVRDRAVNHLAHARSVGPTWKDGTPTQRRLVRATTTYTVEAEYMPPAVGEQPETQETRLVELHVRYRVQLRHEGDADWKPSHPSLDYEDREDADESAALSRELYPRREYRVVIRTTTITEQP